MAGLALLLVGLVVAVVGLWNWEVVWRGIMVVFERDGMGMGLRCADARGDGQRVAGDRAVSDREIVPRRERRASPGVEDAFTAERNEVQVPACHRGRASSFGKDVGSESTAASSFTHKGTGDRHAGNGVERATGSVARAHEEVLAAVVPGGARDHSFHRDAAESGGDAEVRDRVHDRVGGVGASGGSSRGAASVSESEIVVDGGIRSLIITGLWSFRAGMFKHPCSRGATPNMCRSVGFSSQQ